jgi:dephospho-CoA kinase
MIFTVALTGGIASGKSTVSDMFAALGICVVDTDVLARQVVARGSSGLAALIQLFGTEVLTSDGELDRRAMRERVFADPAARGKLESLTHPRIRDAALADLARCTSAYAVLAVPLLYENRDAYAWVDRVLVIDVSTRTQLQRLLARDGVDRTLAEAMLDAQASREQRLAIADDVLDNEGKLETLALAVKKLHDRYLVMACS